jgi:hypothetical protein
VQAVERRHHTTKMIAHEIKEVSVSSALLASAVESIETNKGQRTTGMLAASAPPASVFE